MSNNSVFKKTGADGKTYLVQAQHTGGVLSIEIDESDVELAKLVDYAISSGDLSKVLQYRREHKKSK